ncbi:MAG: hypothetical protein OQK78_09925 [Gammaproteobacteria bacterium]|nr:hypothetical protein [Gammaproteobacteria bacterium]
MLDRETGILPGVGLNYSHSIPGAEFNLYSNMFSGLVNYDGHTQAGTPHTTQTDTLIADVGLVVKLPLTSQHQTITAGYGSGFWSRNILPNAGVGGLYELYRWSTSSLGYEYQQRLDTHHLILSIDRLWHSNSSMKIDFDGINPSIVPLKNSTGWQGSVHYAFDIDQQWQFISKFKWQKWSSKKSDSVVINSIYGLINVHEPRSMTNTNTLSLSLKYSF